jgi:hypothetical protein
VAATTLASLRNLVPASQDCSRDACSEASAAVRPDHVVLPLALPCAVVFVANGPTLLLSSRWRARCLWVAAGQVVVLWASLWACAWVFFFASRAYAYAMSLHFALLILDQGCPPVFSISPGLHSLARGLATALLLAWAAYAGPSLPVLDTPALSSCCGAKAHLLAWVSAETLGRAAVAILACVWPK